MTRPPSAQTTASSGPPPTTTARAGGGPERRPAGRRRGQSWQAAEAWAGYLFIAPVTLFLVVFQFYPLVRGGYLSMTESGFFGGSEFTGLANYARLLGDEDVVGAFRNSLFYTLMILAGVPVAMLIAVQLNLRGLRFRSWYRVVFFLPVVVLPVAAGLVWSTVFNGEYGPINAALEAVGLSGRSWLQDKSTALLCVGLVGVWSTLGYNVVLFLAGLQSIPDELYDAAAIDGAGRWRVLRSITVPMLTPVTFFVSVTSVIAAMQMFDLMFTMIGVANGGVRNPVINDTQTVVYLFYRVGFIENDRGYASTIAVVLVAVVLVLTLIQFRLQRRWVNYA